MSKESEHYCQYCGNSNQSVNFAPVGSGLCIFGCHLDCYKQVSPFDTCEDWKPRRHKEAGK